MLPRPVVCLSAAVITKAICLNVATAGAYLCFVPPQPAPSDGFREKYSYRTTSFDANTSAFVSRLLCVLSTWVVFMSTLDTLHTLDLFPQVIPVKHTTAARAFNAQLIIGLVLTTTSSALRVVAFRNLGRFFTYQLTILSDHKLVTHGLYSYVRHPSYTALLFALVGVFSTVTAPGSVLHDFLGVKFTRKLMVMLALGVASLVPLMIRRANVEDQVLRKEFGKEWEEWARVVRYKFIPGVL